MKAHLLFPNSDFDWSGKAPWNATALSADLSLPTVFEAMSDGDEAIRDICRKVVFAGLTNDLDVVRHRQAVLQDCIDNPELVREVHALTLEIAKIEQRHYLTSGLARYPDWVLRRSVELMELYIDFLKRLRALADRERHRFGSAGWRSVFDALIEDLDDDFFDRASNHSRELKSFSGMALSAALGPANTAADYVLHRVIHHREPAWWRKIMAWLFARRPPLNSFDIHPLDESGIKMVDAIRMEGLRVAAGALGRSTDHVFDFFVTLRRELSFYVGCLNLRDRLVANGAPYCIPAAAPPADLRLRYESLYDLGLALTLKVKVVGNDGDGDGRNLLVITGANQGGKSTFLRSLGLAQLLVQAGMFAPAKALSLSLCDGLLTHYKREEDAALQAGKLDEELARASEIVDHMTVHPLILFNEPFASTNEREGSEIAWQFMTALLEKQGRIACVTHLYELAHRFEETLPHTTLFLRAERRDDGARTFRLDEAAPLKTSFGQDLYEEVFGERPLMARGPPTSAPQHGAG